MTITHTLRSAAGIDVLWALTLDVERWPGLSPTMSAVEKLDPGPMRVGSRARVRQPGQGARIWTVTELTDEPDHKCFCWRTTGPGLSMTGGHDLHTDGSGTVSTLTLETGGPLGAVLAVVLRPALRRAITQENEGFARAAESVGA